MATIYEAKTLIIDEQYVYKFTTVTNSVDPNLIYPCIYLAQEKNIRPYLGDNLYAKILEDIYAENLADDYLNLVKSYIADALLWATMVELIPKLTYKYANSSLVQRISEDTTPISDARMKDEVDRARDNARYFLKSLTDHLCASSDLYPEYSNNVSPQRCPIKPSGIGWAMQVSNGRVLYSGVPSNKQNQIRKY